MTSKLVVDMCSDTHAMSSMSVVDMRASTTQCRPHPHWHGRRRQTRRGAPDAVQPPNGARVSLSRAGRPSRPVASLRPACKIRTLAAHNRPTPRSHRCECRRRTTRRSQTPLSGAHRPLTMVVGATCEWPCRKHMTLTGDAVRRSQQLSTHSQPVPERPVSGCERRRRSPALTKPDREMWGSTVGA